MILETNQAVRRLAQLVRATLFLQGREAIGLRPGASLEHWVAPMANTIRPLLYQLYQAGVISIGTPELEYASQTGHPGLTHELHSHTRVIKSLRGPRSYYQDTMDAVNRATVTLCQATIDTSRGMIADAEQSVIRAMARGLSQEEGKQELTRRMRAIFTDPYRAMRIAVTEYVRFTNMGRLNAAKKRGRWSSKRWKPGWNSCAQCIELSELGPIDIEESFTIVPGGGPYAVVDHPPLHPHCDCGVEYLP